LQSLFDKRNNILFKQTEIKLLGADKQRIDDRVALQVVDVICFPRPIQMRQNLANDPVRTENETKCFDPRNSLGTDFVCSIKQPLQKHILLVLKCGVIRLLPDGYGQCHHSLANPPLLFLAQEHKHVVQTSSHQILPCHLNKLLE